MRGKITRFHESQCQFRSDGSLLMPPLHPSKKRMRSGNGTAIATSPAQGDNPTQAIDRAVINTAITPTVHANGRRSASAPRTGTTALVRQPGATSASSVGIRELDTSCLVGSQRVGIIGLPGTGKSTCCRSLLADLRYAYPVVAVCSNSETDNPFYSTMLPRLFVHTKLTNKVLKMFINRQRLALGCNSPLKDGLLILDDCFEQPQDLDNQMVRMLFKQGRHLRASVYVVQQYIVDLKPYARSTTSAVFLFHCPSARDRRLLFQNYGACFPDYNTFCACYNAICGEPHTAMVILNQGNGRGDFRESVFWYRPRMYNDADAANLRLCHPSLWEHANERTDKSRLDTLALLSCDSVDEK